MAAHRPNGPNIVPNMPAPVGLFDLELDSDDVADDIIQRLVRDTAHTQTRLNQTLHAHYYQIIERAIDESMARFQHPAERPLFGEERRFACSVLDIIRRHFEANLFHDFFRDSNLSSALESLVEHYQPFQMPLGKVCVLLQRLELLLEHIV